MLRTCFDLFSRYLIKSVYETHVGAGDQVAVGVHRDLDGTVPHLLFYVHNCRPVLEEQRSECMTEIVKANLADASLGQHGEEYAMLEVIGIEDRPFR